MDGGLNGSNSHTKMDEEEVRRLRRIALKDMNQKHAGEGKYAIPHTEDTILTLCGIRVKQISGLVFEAAYRTHQADASVIRNRNP